MMFSTLPKRYVILFLFFLTGSCTPGNQSEEEASGNEDMPVTPVEEELPVNGTLLTITTNQMEFNTTSEIPAGLTTVRYENNSGMTHFVLFEKMPVVDGVQYTMENTQEEVVPVFDEAMQLINEGKTEEGMALFGNLPEWFGQIQFTGGIGLTGPKSVSQSTFYLQPGTYTLECYVKSDGVFHSANGMLATVVVTGEEPVEGELPESDITIDVNEEGYVMTGTPKAGLQTFRVNYNYQKVHENFVMHDVNVVRIDEGVNPNEVQFWMNWLDPNAFGTPCPAVFVGGLGEMAAGSSGLFTVRLEPGDYALVAEVPNSGQKGLYKSFSVPETQSVSME